MILPTGGQPCKCEICERSRHCDLIRSNGNMAAMSELIGELLDALIDTEEELGMLRAHVNDLREAKA